MAKVKIGPQPLIYPMPLLLVGAHVLGRPNLLAVAWGGIANGEPPMVSVAVRHERYTHDGIEQEGAFSVNIPSADIVKQADYCGLFSGERVDKTAACGFDIFYGDMANVPLIKQCPVNLECRLVNSLDLGSHSLFIGRIEQTHISEDCLTRGKPDVEKIAPFAYITSPASQYQVLGEVIGKAFGCGKKL
jgi:flavin reductase (DIM6/NTAB) family NADH-FMN oxidoreductase RutF